MFRPLNPRKYKGDPTNIIYRSSWEFKVMRKLDTDPNVEEWHSEELAIPYRYRVDNRMHRYFIDFYCKLKDGRKYLIEVKPYDQTQPPVQGKKTKRRFLQEVLEYTKNQDKWEAAEKYCLQHGYEFQIITEKELGIK